MVGPAIELVVRPLSDPFRALTVHNKQPLPPAKLGPVERPMNVHFPHRTVCADTGFPGEWNTCANFSTRGVTPTLWESTSTIAFKPARSLITRFEFRYDKSDRNVFLYGSHVANRQETASFQVIYLF